MNSLVNKLIFTLLLIVGSFGVLNVSKVEACQIIDSGTGFRPSGILNDFDDEGEWVYFDVQTQNCNTAPSTFLEIKFIDIDTSNMSERPIHDVSVEVGQISTLLSNNSINFKTHQSGFTIPILLREEGNEGDCNFDDGTNWILILNPAILALQSSFADIPDCMLFAKIFDVNTGALMHSEGSVTSPQLVYECDGICDTNWVVGCPSSTTGAGYPPTPLPYGPPNICSVDDGIIPNVTTIGGGEASGSTLTYSEDALAPLPGFSNAPDLGEFLEALFTILIVIAGLLAMIMIIVGGVTYMTSDAFGKKQDGKEYIINAIVGLILALGAWVILNTINPDLAQDLNISIPVVELGNYNVDSSGIVSETPAGTTGTSSICKDPNVNQVPNCPTCQPIPAPVQSQVANNRATPSTISKLVSFQSSISGIPWTVTEGFSPSRAHCARCHYTGTCIDADFTIAPTNINVKAFIDAAKSNGLKAQYETSSVSEFNSLVEFGLIPRQEVLLFPGTWISGSHFSVYNQ